MKLLLLLILSINIGCTPTDSLVNTQRQGIRVPQIEYFKDHTTAQCFCRTKYASHFTYVPCTPEVEAEIARTPRL